MAAAWLEGCWQVIIGVDRWQAICSESTQSRITLRFLKISRRPEWLQVALTRGWRACAA
jgi:hypothetical protein